MEKKTKKVLVYENDSGIQEVYALELEHRGFIVKCVTEENRILRTLRSSEYDIILFDISTVPSNLYSMLKKIRREFEEIPIVLNGSLEPKQKEMLIKNIMNVILKSEGLDELFDEIVRSTNSGEIVPIEEESHEIVYEDNVHIQFDLYEDEEEETDLEEGFQLTDYQEEEEELEDTSFLTLDDYEPSAAAKPKRQISRMLKSKEEDYSDSDDEEDYEDEEEDEYDEEEELKEEYEDEVEEEKIIKKPTPKKKTEEKAAKTTQEIRKKPKEKEKEVKKPIMISQTDEVSSASKKKPKIKPKKELFSPEDYLDWMLEEAEK
ncbi:MAG: response regulator [Candidatus Coatesbacteria bacterium]|nr:response regulator [Candidatus Coatesbacteria bacterium]